MQLDFKPVGAAVFAVVFLGLVFLVYTGRAPFAALGAVIAWLIPSPIQIRSQP